MQKLIMLYWGTILLMYLSQLYYPTRNQIRGGHTGKYNFMQSKSDLFMIIVVFWLSAFSFLRTSYNDSPLSSKRQKNICTARHLAIGAIF